MEIKEARLILEKIKFLHFRFSVEKEMWNHILMVTVDAPDTKNRKAIIRVVHRRHFDLDDMRDAQDLIEFVHDFVLIILGHEADEIFTVEGQNNQGYDPYNQHEPDLREQKWETIMAMFKQEPSHDNDINAGRHLGT